MIPLSLYIHIPWCVRKCPYCDFNSHEQRNELPEKDYISQLLVDLQSHLPHIQGRDIQSIFIGGGTPSLFSANAYQQLFSQLRDFIHIARHAEITLEANPGASEQQRFYGFREAGINRLSLGIQSWENEKLTALGRIHSAEQALQAVAMAKQAGFTNFNLDIMHGLPGQSLSQAMADLKKTIECHPTHISWYQLTLEPNTYFHRFPPALPDDEISWQIHQQGQQLLLEAGFYQYEISAFSQEDCYSRHNLNYWQFGDYIGVGAGAHSKITQLNDGSVWRYWKVKNPREYLLPNKSLIDGQHRVSKEELGLEFMMNAFRLHQKIPLKMLNERTGLHKDDIKTPLQQAQDLELITITDDSITVTSLGKRFLNDLLALFMPTQ